MSLINDAIKRAAKAQPNQPSPVTKPIQLQPAVHARPAAVWWLYFIPSLLVVCLAGGGYLVMRGWQHRQTGLSDMPQSSPLPVAARERALPATNPAAGV